MCIFLLKLSNGMFLIPPHAESPLLDHCQTTNLSSGVFPFPGVKTALAYSIAVTSVRQMTSPPFLCHTNVTTESLECTQLTVNLFCQNVQTLNSFEWLACLHHTQLV